VSNLQIKPLHLPGLCHIKRDNLDDSRGFLSRLFCMTELAAAGWVDPIQQINYTHSAKRGTVRGMHFQRFPNAEMKMVTCIKGEIFDVAVDIRPSSPTFLQWHGEILSSKNKSSLIIPQGFAHGFQTLVDDCELIYFHSESYSPSSESGVSFNDPSLNITWPNKVIEVSARDKSHKLIDMNFQGAELI